MAELLTAVVRAVPGLADPSFCRFASVGLSLLGVALLVVALLRRSPLRESPAVQHAWIATRSWLIMLPAILLAVGFGSTVFIVVVCLLSIGCVKEFARATGLYQDWLFVGTVYAGIVALYWSAWIEWYGLFMALPVYAVTAILLLPAFQNRYEGMIQRIGLSMIAFIYFGWFLAHLAYLANSPMRYAYLLFLIIGVELNDAAAYTAGRLFGRHPLIANISPRKTREGALGALVVTTLYVLALHRFLGGLEPSTIGLTILILWLGGLFGDLVISVVKRDIGIKDMGVFIPGHGGLLDRFDSLILASPLFFHTIRYYVGLDRLP